MHLQTPNCPGSVSHSWRRAESATCIENFRRASRNFGFQLPSPTHLLPYIAGVTFSLFLVSIVESDRCPIVIMAAGKASGKAAASFDEIIRAGTATPPTKSDNPFDLSKNVPSF